jgi:hypothetical protein
MEWHHPADAFIGLEDLKMHHFRSPLLITTDGLPCTVGSVFPITCASTSLSVAFLGLLRHRPG